jgi:hypothetical protein
MLGILNLKCKRQDLCAIHTCLTGIYILMQVVLLLCLLCYFSTVKVDCSLMVLEKEKCSLLSSNTNVLLVLIFG